MRLQFMGDILNSLKESKYVCVIIISKKYPFIVEKQDDINNTWHLRLPDFWYFCSEIFEFNCVTNIR